MSKWSWENVLGLALLIFLSGLFIWWSLDHMRKWHYDRATKTYQYK